jgi:hypothetical protein
MLDRVQLTVPVLLGVGVVHVHSFGVMLANCDPDGIASVTATLSAVSGPWLLTVSVYVRVSLTDAGLGVADRLIPRSAMCVPVPDSATVCGLAGASSAKLSRAVRDPVADGLNVMYTVHD